MTASVLIADDDRHFLLVLQKVLHQAGYIVHSANNGVDACALGRHSPIDACLLDIALPLMSGPDVARELGRPTLFVSGRDWDRLADDNPFPSRCLRKPVDLGHLLETLADLLAQPTPPNPTHPA